MKFYIEITLLPSVDVGINFLWAKLYQQVHLALVEMSDGKGELPIGAAFPEYDADRHSLGSKLRLFGKSESDLARMDIRKWLNRLFDYVHITQIREVPNEIISYSIYKRKQPNRSFAKLERLIKRRAMRENISLEEARSKIIENNVKAKDDNTVVLKIPFIQLKSLSSESRFRLFINHDKAPKYFDGNFNCYGLSDKATVPDF